MEREYKFWVYIMASRSKNLYTGMTDSIDRRVSQPQERRDRRVHETVQDQSSPLLRRVQVRLHAIRREKQIKGLDRKKRIALIESMNPTWQGLAENWGKPIKPLRPVVK